MLNINSLEIEEGRSGMMQSPVQCDFPSLSIAQELDHRSHNYLTFVHPLCAGQGGKS